MSTEEFLAVLYRHQQGCFFPNEIMDGVMEELALSAEEAVALLRECLDRGWLVMRGYKPERYLTHDRVSRFPVVLSAEALAGLRGKGIDG
jgi:hypothetical protein